MGIKIYDHISILRNFSKEKIYRAKVALKGSEIARNVGVHCYLPNAKTSIDPF